MSHRIRSRGEDGTAAARRVVACCGAARAGPEAALSHRSARCDGGRDGRRRWGEMEAQIACSHRDSRMTERLLQERLIAYQEQQCLRLRRRNLHTGRPVGRQGDSHLDLPERCRFKPEGEHVGAARASERKKRRCELGHGRRRCRGMR